MSEERPSPHPQDGTTKWMSGAPLWDSYVADLAARTTVSSSSLAVPPDPTFSSASPVVPGRYFLPPWNFNPAAANLGPNCAGGSVGAGPNLWNVTTNFSGNNRCLPSIGLGVPPAFPGGGPSFFQAQDKMLNEFLTRPPPIHESAAPRPSSASVLGEKLAAEALTALNFNLNMNGVRCGDQIPTTSTQETMPLDKAHLLRGILQGCNRAVSEGMDLMTEPLVRDFSGKIENNNMVMKAATRPDVIGRLLGSAAAARRSRRESAAPPVRDRRSIKRPRQDSLILRTMQEKYEMEKAMVGQSPFMAKELPPPPPLRPASANLSYKLENGDMHHSEKGSDNEMEDKRQSDMDENSNGPVHIGNGDNVEEMGNPDDEELPESVVGLAESVVGSVDDEEINGTTEEEMTNGDDCSQPPASPAGSTSSAADVKKARVENIVSVMRASPILGQGPVNGCKKRKLYQPQQHSGDEDAGASVPAKLIRTDEVGQLANGEETTDDSQDEGEQPEMSRPASTNGQESQHRPAYSVPTPESNRRYSPEPAPLREKSNLLSPSDLADLGETLKAEMFASLASIVDSIVSRYTGLPANGSRSSRLLAQLGRTNNRLEAESGRQSPRSVTNKVLDGRSSTRYSSPAPAVPTGPTSGNASAENINVLNLARMQSNLFQNKQFGSYQLGAAASSNVINLSSQPASWHSPQSPLEVPEQKEALSLVVTPKKKRQKVTDSRPGARPFGKYIGSGSDQEYSPKTEFTSDSPSPRESNSVPTSLATPIGLQNAAIHPDILSSYSAAAAAAFYGNLSGRASHHLGHNDLDSTPNMLHQAALLSAAHQAASPADLFGYGDSQHHMDSPVTELTYDGYRPISSTLTPMHLRKAKLMFFWVRYPSSAILKTYFPDINFNKNNTAQLVKWFSNFREFYYIQMEKYARQVLAEGVENPEDIRVNPENCELLRILNLHYNRNNHIDMPASFSYVVEQTMREFFKAVKEGKDCEPTWKKTIYKIIARLDDTIPEYFKTQSFLEQLE